MRESTKHTKFAIKKVKGVVAAVMVSSLFLGVSTLATQSASAAEYNDNGTFELDGSEDLETNDAYVDENEAASISSNTDQSAQDAYNKAQADDLNEYRAEKGIDALKSQEDLNAFAKWKIDSFAKELPTINDIRVFNQSGGNPHEYDGKTLEEQYEEFHGYAPESWLGENLAYTQGYIQDETAGELSDLSMEMWDRSPGHKANMVNDNYGSVGTGYWTDEDGTYYAIQVFESGKRVVTEVPAPPVNPEAPDWEDGNQDVYTDGDTSIDNGEVVWPEPDEGYEQEVPDDEPTQVVPEPEVTEPEVETPVEETPDPDVETPAEDPIVEPEADTEVEDTPVTPEPEADDTDVEVEDTPEIIPPADTEPDVVPEADAPVEDAEEDTIIETPDAESPDTDNTVDADTPEQDNTESDVVPEAGDDTPAEDNTPAERPDSTDSDAAEDLDSADTPAPDTGVSDEQTSTEESISDDTPEQNTGSDNAGGVVAGAVITPDVVDDIDAAVNEDTAAVLADDVTDDEADMLILPAQPAANQPVDTTQQVVDVNTENDTTHPLVQETAVDAVESAEQDNTDVAVTEPVAHTESIDNENEDNVVAGSSAQILPDTGIANTPMTAIAGSIMAGLAAIAFAATARKKRTN